MFIKNAVVSAGKKLLGQKSFEELQRQFLVQLVFMTAAQLKNYLSRATAEEQSSFFIVPQNIKRKADRRKLILVLDMDETLVYTRRQKQPHHSNYKVAKNEDEDMYVEMRPHAKEFLIAASQIFTIFVYTAGAKKYADAVLDTLDTDGLIERRFYRDSCKKVGGKLVKDLRYLKRALRIRTDMVLVDDNMDSIRNNYPFSVGIEAFEGNQEDKYLCSTFKTLLKFYN